MKTYMLKLDDSHEDVIQALAKALKIDIQLISDLEEDNGLITLWKREKNMAVYQKPTANHF